jgi:hypothetical protein
MILSAEAKPYAFRFDPVKTALVLSQSACSIALQRFNNDLNGVFS